MKKSKIVILISVLVVAVITIVASIQNATPIDESKVSFGEKIENAISDKINDEWYADRMGNIYTFDNFSHVFNFNEDFINKANYYNNVEESVRISKIGQRNGIKKVNKVLYTDTLDNSYTYSIILTTNEKFEEHIYVVSYYLNKDNKKIGDIIMISEPSKIEKNKTWKFSTQFLLNRPSLENGESIKNKTLK